MMDRNFIAIQTVRRLIQAGRYDEAYVLLKETNHPQVPALEAKLSAIIAARKTAPTPPPIVTRWSLVVGCLLGLIFAVPFRSLGLVNVPGMLACFGIGFTMGMVMPAHVRRRVFTSEMLMQMYLQRKREQITRR